MNCGGWRIDFVLDFVAAEEAAHAYDEAAVRILGDLAQLNFPKENN